MTSLYHALQNPEGTACFVFHDAYGLQREVKGEPHPESKIRVFLEIGGELARQHPNGMKYVWFGDRESTYFPNSIPVMNSEKPNSIVSGGWHDCTRKSGRVLWDILVSQGWSCVIHNEITFPVSVLPRERRRSTRSQFMNPSCPPSP